MTWHCMLDRFATVVSALGVVRRWAAGGMAMSAVSDVAAAPLRRVLGSAGPVSVLPNGIDVSGVAAAGSATRRRRRPVRHGDAARQPQASGPADAGDATGALARPRRAQIALEVLGEGPDRGSVERYLAEHGMASWVSLPGRVPRTSVRDRYASADVYISPARLESFGIAALEARTSGLPVVARSGSGVGEFVTDGVNGFLTDDDASMAAALARLASDDTLRDADARSQPPPGARAGLAAGGRAGRGGVPARGRARRSAREWYGALGRGRRRVRGRTRP